MALPIFPITVAYGSKFMTEYKTRVFEAESGYEQRNAVWDQPRFRADVSTGIQTQDDLSQLLSFFRIVRGKAEPFLFRDWSDYQLVNQTIGTGDGATVSFQIIKTYIEPITNTTQTRNIKYMDPNNNNLIVTVGGVEKTVNVDFTIDYNTGLLTFNSAPATGADVVISSGEFFIKCRFDTDKIELELEAYKLGNWANVEIVEVRS